MTIRRYGTAASVAALAAAAALAGGPAEGQAQECDWAPERPVT